jgi:hypothetical protein
MNRNLGATFAGLGSGAGTGLFYQWGRKDPFPATGNPGTPDPTSATFTATNGPKTMVEAIQSPGVFIGNYGGDWLDSSDSTLWGHENHKTIYDPCPKGWRVPSQYSDTSPWFGWSASNFKWTDKGRTYGDDPNAQYYPAAGYRNYSNGRFSDVGSFGTYWSASVTGSYGYCLDFSSGYVDPSYDYYRAFGYSVRCVQE